MSGIMVVDDDVTSISIIEETLGSHDYTVYTYDSAAAAVEEFEPGAYDLILSDYFMPGMNGDEFLQRIRQKDMDTPFVFLTANTDIQLAIELVKSGADDHVTKPIVPDELLFRIEKNLREKQNERAVKQAERERELLEMEREKLVNWRLLYASKDVHQTEQMINLLSRTINQAGGFVWVDLLEQQIQGQEGANYELSSELVDMVLTAGRSQKQIFDYITFISELDTLELDQRPVNVGEFVQELNRYMKDLLSSLSGRQERPCYSVVDVDGLEGNVEVDMEYMRRMAKELIINAVKYSPEGSRVLLIFEQSREVRGRYLDVRVRNAAKPAQARDGAGKRILGIPYEYTELVFDLFYTVEAFPVSLEEEEWSDGTGLYVVRKLARRQGGWVKAANGVDYTGGSPQTFVEVTMTLPVKEAS